MGFRFCWLPSLVVMVSIAAAVLGSTNGSRIKIFSSLPLTSAQSTIIFEDSFNHGDDAIVGNGWVEVENGSATAEISINKLKLNAHDQVNRPVVTHSFPKQTSGNIRWTFVHEISRTGSEGVYEVFMQLGEGAIMTDPSSSDNTGVAVNLKWAGPNQGMNNHEGFGHVNGTTGTQMAVISGGGGSNAGGQTTIMVDIDLDLKLFRISLSGPGFISGLTSKTGIGFDNDVDIDTVRFYYDAFHEKNFATRNFGDIKIEQMTLDTSPPTAPSNVRPMAISESQIDLTWGGASDPGSGIRSYIIYRNGIEVGSSSTTTFSDMGLTEGTSYIYEVSAVNGAGLEGAKSATVTGTTLADTIPITVESATASGDPTRVEVIFSEAVEQVRAESPANYSIDNGISVSAASLGVDLKTVTLTTSALSEGVSYTLTVQNVRDRAQSPNPMDSTQIPFTFNPQGPLSGQIIVDPANPAWLKYKDGGPFFMCAPGDPEGFLYRGTRNPDGTRNGDQLALINKLKGTGANGIYLMAWRSPGGDGAVGENPFIDSDPSKPLDQDILNQWEQWFTEMDNDGIVIYFFFYDDALAPDHPLFKTGDIVGDAEREFVEGLVNRFQHHKNLIWVIKEEYREAFTPTRVSNIASVIRAADDHDHIIAVHKLSGLDFSEFADDPNIEQFAIQYNVGTASELHSGMVTAWNSAAGRYNLNMSEAAGYGTGASARLKNWAVTMGGAYVMALGWDIANTPLDTLEDCGRLVSFIQSTNFYQMAPHDELKHAGTEYILALPGDSYVAYASNLVGNIGLRNMTAGMYSFLWFDPINGATINQVNLSVAAGDQSWSKPAEVGNEVAVYIKRTGAANDAPVALEDAYSVDEDTTLNLAAPGVLGNDSDVDVDTLTAVLVSGPANGTLTLNPDGSFSYTPNANSNGSDSFTYKASDGLVDSNVATVTITVSAANDAPVALDDAYSVDADNTLNVAAPGVLGNVSDVEGIRRRRCW